MANRSFEARMFGVTRSIFAQRRGRGDVAVNLPLHARHTALGSSK